MNKKIGILICGHGSSDPDSHKPFNNWVEELQQKLSYPCLAGFLECQQPSIMASANQLIDQGVECIYAIPALLLAGRHSQKDIPLELAKIDESIEVIYLSHIIEHPLLLEAAMGRIKEVMEDIELSACQVLFIAHGSRNPQANETVIKLSQQLKEQANLLGCIAAFGQFGAPSLVEILSKLKPGSYTALPYFLFTGKPLKEAQKQIADFLQQHPNHSIKMTAPLGGHPLITKAFCDTLNQAIKDPAALYN